MEGQEGWALQCPARRPTKIRSTSGSFPRSHEPLHVERDLRVKIVAKRLVSLDELDLLRGGPPDVVDAIEKKRQAEEAAPVRPGDNIQVTVTTTDPQGQAGCGRSEFGDGEQSLLDRFGGNISAIDEFFRGVAA